MSAKLDQVLERLETPRAPRAERSARRVDTEYPRVSKRNETPAALPSKAELCRQWFADHPEDVHRTNRDLAANVHPLGVRISQAYWGRVKRERAR